MPSVWLFTKALFRHWWTLLSCAIFTGLTAYTELTNRSNHWSVTASGVAAAGLFFVAASRTWKEEYERRRKLEAASSWKLLSEQFKTLSSDPRSKGMIFARWHQDLDTGEYSDFAIDSRSAALSKLCAEMCSEAGKRLLNSVSLCQKFPSLMAIKDDGDRWLVAIREVTELGIAREKTDSRVDGKAKQGQWVDLPDLTGASQALCYRLMNEFAR